MCQQKSSKEYYDKNKDKHRERAKKYYLQNKNAMDEYYSSWHKKHEDRLRLMEKKAFAAQIKRLDDRYVKRLMMKRGMLPEQMSQPLIELYKILILIKREINQKLKEKAK